MLTKIIPSEVLHKLEQEEIKLMHKINKNIFGADFGSFGFLECKCGTLMEWYNNIWHCPNCNLKLKQTEKGKDDEMA